MISLCKGRLTLQRQLEHSDFSFEVLGVTILPSSQSEAFSLTEHISILLEEWQLSPYLSLLLQSAKS